MAADKNGLRTIINKNHFYLNDSSNGTNRNNSHLDKSRLCNLVGLDATGFYSKHWMKFNVYHGRYPTARLNYRLARGKMWSLMYVVMCVGWLAFVKQICYKRSSCFSGFMSILFTLSPFLFHKCDFFFLSTHTSYYVSSIPDFDI